MKRTHVSLVSILALWGMGLSFRSRSLAQEAKSEFRVLGEQRLCLGHIAEPVNKLVSIQARWLTRSDSPDYVGTRFRTLVNASIGATTKLNNDLGGFDTLPGDLAGVTERLKALDVWSRRAASDLATLDAQTTFFQDSLGAIDLGLEEAELLRQFAEAGCKGTPDEAAIAVLKTTIVDVRENQVNKLRNTLKDASKARRKLYDQIFSSTREKLYAQHAKLARKTLEETRVDIDAILGAELYLNSLSDWFRARHVLQGLAFGRANTLFQYDPALRILKQDLFTLAGKHAEVDAMNLPPLSAASVHRAISDFETNLKLAMQDLEKRGPKGQFAAQLATVMRARKAGIVTSPDCIALAAAFESQDASVITPVVTSEAEARFEVFRSQCVKGGAR